MPPWPAVLRPGEKATHISAHLARLFSWPAPVIHGGGQTWFVPEMSLPAGSALHTLPPVAAVQPADDPRVDGLTAHARLHKGTGLESVPLHPGLVAMDPVLGKGMSGEQSPEGLGLRVLQEALPLQ